MYFTTSKYPVRKQYATGFNIQNTVTTYQQNADAFKDALMEKQVVNKMKTKVRLQERAKKTQGTEQAKDDCAKVQKLKDQANDFSWD